MYSSEWDVLSVCQTRTPSPHKGFFPPFIALWSNPTCHCGKITMRQRGSGGAGGQRREEDGGKMRGVNREGVSERKRERWEALNLPSRVQRGRKYPRKRMSMCVCMFGWVCVCVRESETVSVYAFMRVWVCVCVSNKGEKTTHLNVRYGEAWRAGREEWGEEGWEEWIWITGMKILLFSARFSDLFVAML